MRPGPGSDRRAPLRQPQEFGTSVGSASVHFWFDPAPVPFAAPPFDPRKVARAVLAELPQTPGWSSPVPRDLRDGPITPGANSVAVRFHQVLGEYRVRPAEVVVNLSRDGHAHSVFRHYHGSLPASLVAKALSLGERDACAIAEGCLAECRPWRLLAIPELIVHQRVPYVPRAPARLLSSRAHGDRLLRALLERSATDGPEYRLVWDLRVVTEKPVRRWRLLVDARTGELAQVEDLRYFAAGTGKVFDPNPMVTSGNRALTWNDAALLAAQTVPVSLERLIDPPGQGKFRLDGTHVLTVELNDPAVPEPEKATPNFEFVPEDPDFLSVMAYFHIDRFRVYLQDTLGLTHIPVRAVHVDTTVEGEDTTAGDDVIRFSANAGSRLGHAPDATDALVIIHEYGHVLQSMLLPDSVHGNEPAGISEGFGDFIAGTYYDGHHKPGAGTRGLLFPWSRPKVRNYRVKWKFGDTHWQAGAAYEKGQLWCATMFEAYRKLGGDSRVAEVRDRARDLAIRLFTAALTKIPIATPVSPPSEAILAAAIEEADAELDGFWCANGLHRKVLRDTFGRRGVTGCRPQDPLQQVDVYIDDGRKGSYGSIKANPTFDDSLWMEDHGGPPGVWVQAAGGAAGPPGAASVKAGVAAQVFARVKNRGGTDSGPVTVKVFVAQPGAARAWPVDWSTVSLNPTSKVVGNVPKKPSQGVVVGPSSWTPTLTGVHTLLVIVECPLDQAVTELLQVADPVPIMDFVPFDNNIAMRDIQVNP